MELKFIYAEDPRGLLRFDEFLPVYGVQLLKTLLVDCFHSVLAEPGDLCNLFVGICPDGE